MQERHFSIRANQQTRNDQERPDVGAPRSVACTMLKTRSFISVDLSWFKGAPVPQAFRGMPSFPTASVHRHVVSCFTAVALPKLQQTMTGFRALLKGNVTVAGSIVSWCSLPAFSLQPPVCCSDSRLPKPWPCYYTVIARSGFNVPAQICLGGRVRPGDFNTVNLHPPGDLQESDFLYLREKKLSW